MSVGEVHQSSHHNRPSREKRAAVGAHPHEHHPGSRNPPVSVHATRASYEAIEQRIQRLEASRQSTRAPGQVVAGSPDVPMISGDLPLAPRNGLKSLPAPVAEFDAPARSNAGNALDVAVVVRPSPDRASTGVGSSPTPDTAEAASSSAPSDASIDPELATSTDGEYAQHYGSFPVLVGGQMVELDLYALRNKGVDNRLIVTLKGAATDSPDTLREHMKAVGALAARLGWKFESVEQGSDPMSQVTNIVATIMHADADALRIAANNVSNSNGVAFRRELQVRHLDFASLARQHAPAAAADPADLQLPQTEVAIDTRAGTLRNTGEPLDVALQGDGYFVVDTAQGQLVTRRGDFHVNESGVLSAFTGDPVLGTEGTIQIPSGTVKIAADGTVTVGSSTVGHLRAVQLDPNSRLAESGNGLFTVAGGEPSPSPSAQFRQGFLETSNVQPVTEMMHLMETVRHFEASQRYMRAYDEMLDKGINDLGQI